MMMGFALFDRAMRSQRRSGAQPDDYVVARAARAAPSAWVFFDGSEALVTERSGARVRVPGGAFFVDEAFAYPSAWQAQAQAERLNALSRDTDGEAWVAITVRSVIHDMTAFTPVIGGTRQRLGGS